MILPDHLEIIGDYAFYLCTNLKYLELPEGLRKIGSFAFRASGLKELRLPSAVNEMDGTSLYGMEIKIAEKNDAYRMVDGIIYSANGLGLIAFPSTIEGRYEISSEVKSIGKYAFYNTSLADITIPGSVLKVGEHAFDHGEKLEKVVIEEGTYLLNHYAFLGCKSLSDVTIPKSVMEEGERICPNCGYEKNSGSQPPNALRRGTILRSRYYIGNVIGQGGFGITYVGWDLTLEMKVAVKEYFPSGSASRTNLYSNEIQWEFTDSGEAGWSEGLERFLKEARKMAKLDSIPAVVRVWDAFGENRTAYIVMDFVEGITLKKYLQTHGVLGYEECLNLLLPILDSLAVIHDRGLIHRDISPDNIMIQPDGSARLLDMGAAVDVRANDGLASMAVVKRNFSAPEQYMDSERLGSWTDVYAMAAPMNYCITGRVVPEAMERDLKKTSLYYDPGLNLRTR